MTLDEPSPAYVSLSYSSGDATFEISVDPYTQTEEIIESVAFSVALVNYPERPKFKAEFSVVLTQVQDAEQPWVPPPPPEPKPEKEP